MCYIVFLMVKSLKMPAPVSACAWNFKIFMFQGLNIPKNINKNLFSPINMSKLFVSAFKVYYNI